MNDGEALLRQAIEHPDDDQVRLVYADWLQEQGQEERAAFIRLQVSVASELSEFNNWHPDALDMICDPQSADDQKWKHRVQGTHKQAGDLCNRHPEWKPECHACWKWSPAMLAFAPCHTCSGSGRIGEFRKGLLAVLVPTLETVLERVPCKRCGGSGSYQLIDEVTGFEFAEPCLTCEVDAPEWRLTEWGRRLLEWPVETVWVEEAAMRYLRSRRGEGFWWASDRVYDHDALPDFLCGQMNSHQSIDAANETLARAVAMAVREL